MAPMEWKDRLKKRIRDGRFIRDIRTGTEHDITRHTGKSCADMMDRIFAEDKQVISSFHDTESVDDLLSEAVQANLEQLSLLFKNAGPNGRVSISHAFDRNIGTAIRHADDKLQGIDTNAMTAVFTKDSGAGSLGLRLTTAYPCIDRTLCPDMHLSRCRTDLKQEIKNTRKYRHAGPLEQACLENMCDLSSARAYMARDGYTGDVCCVTSSTKKTSYFIEIQEQDHRLRTKKQDRSTGRYAPVVPESDLTPQMQEAFRQKLPKLTVTVDTILSRCKEIQNEKVMERQKRADELLTDIHDAPSPDHEFNL